MQLLPALNQGGVERGTLDIAHALVNAGHESVVVSAGGRLVEALENGGSRHITLDIGKKSLATLFKIGALRRLLLKEKPDIVHLRSRLPAWVFWMAARGLSFRPRVVSTLHGMNSVSRYSQIMTRADHLIAVSQTCLDYWKTHYPHVAFDRASIIYRGIDTAVFKPAGSVADQHVRTHLGVGEGELVVAFPGRITEWKGHRDLLAVAAACKGKPVKFWVIGEGKPGSMFEREIREAVVAQGLSEHVQFLGHRDDIAALLSAADAVLSLTRTTMESFGRVPVEAIACGTPVVAYDHGAVGETLRVLQPEGLVPAGEVDAVVAKLEALPAVPSTVEPFTLANMAIGTLGVYESLTSGLDL